jgi:hypothetical protein
MTDRNGAGGIQTAANSNETYEKWLEVDQHHWWTIFTGGHCNFVVEIDRNSIPIAIFTSGQLRILRKKSTLKEGRCQINNGKPDECVSFPILRIGCSLGGW